MVFKILDAPKENQHLIQDAIEIIYKGVDGDSARLRDKWSLIVKTRFEQKLQQNRDIDFLIDNIGFSVNDLLAISDYFLPHMKEEGIFDFIADQYKANISSRILPFMQDLGYVRENPGVLVNLINWLNSYETLLTKKGFHMNEFAELRSKIKELMPIFHKHVSGIFQKYLDRIATQDDPLLSKQNFEAFETQTPEDVITFLNQQIDFLSVHLSDDMFFNLFSIWLSQL